MQWRKWKRRITAILKRNEARKIFAERKIDLNFIFFFIDEKVDFCFFDDAMFPTNGLKTKFYNL